MNDYPRDLHVDFSKLRFGTLKRYAWYFKIDGSNAISSSMQPKLASTCARHFMQHLEVDEAQVLRSFTAYVVNSNSNSARSVRAVNEFNGLKRIPSLSKLNGEPEFKKRKHTPVDDGRLVAAKVNGNWILCKVIKYLKRKRAYRVEDADELSKDRQCFEQMENHVIALPTDAELSKRRGLPKGCRVLARFPKTSTFYPATVVKCTEKRCSLRFDDDEKGPDGNVRIVKVSSNEVVVEP